MLLDDYRREMEAAGPSKQQIEALAALLKTKEEIPMRKALPRTALVAAVLCAAMVVTVSAAALWGAFDRLKKQDRFALLGMNEVYEEYAYEVNLSVATERGDLFTLERAATDGAFCTIFYSYHYAEPFMTREEFEALDATDPWAAWQFSPQMNLLLDGEVISDNGYQNSFETQEYLADESTVYGAWRCLLTAPIHATADGTELELQGLTRNRADGSEQHFSLAFPSHPNTPAVSYPGVTFSLTWGGRLMTAEAVSFSRSPLGNLLTLRYENNPDAGLGLLNSFVLRDRETGEYIPFARIWTRSNSGGTDLVTDSYELFGDVSGLRELELIPVWYDADIARRQVVSLSDLPSTELGGAPGGYAPASYRVSGNRILVEMRPVGAVSTQYPNIANGVRFLDKDGGDVFKSARYSKFKDRSTGAITVVTTVDDPEEFAANVDRVSALWFFVQDYTLLEDRAVAIPLSVEVE